MLLIKKATFPYWWDSGFCTTWQGNGVVYTNFVPFSFELNPDASCFQIGSKVCEDTPLENIFIQIHPVVFI